MLHLLQFRCIKLYKIEMWPVVTHLEHAVGSALGRIVEDASEKYVGGVMSV